jgi:hypothetical protein
MNFARVLHPNPVHAVHLPIAICSCETCRRDNIHGAPRGNTTHHKYRLAQRHLGYYGTVEGFNTGLKHTEGVTSDVLDEYAKRVDICARFYRGEISDAELRKMYPVVRAAVEVNKMRKGAVGMRGAIETFVEASF